jgi:hypothetical protein
LGDVVAVVTVGQFADVLKVPVDRLLEQFQKAGLPQKSKDEFITDDQKLELLTYLRRAHGVGGDKRSVRLLRKPPDVNEVTQGRNVAERHSATSKLPLRVFVSYSRDDTDHIEWVKRFAAKLRENGVDAILDQWELHPGDDITLFMEKSVTSSEFVVIICTARYKRRADAREGGVGYEGTIISADLYRSTNRRKYVPLLRGASWSKCSPLYLQSSAYIDVRPGAAETSGLRDLLLTVYGRREAAPGLGTPPVELM